LCVLSGNIPSWLVDLATHSSFLLPFDVRRFLFYIMTFDRQRAIQKLLERMPEHDFIHQPGSSRSIQARVIREKAIVDRTELLKSADALFDKTKTSNSCIEVQYVGEVGTGLGPTLEFYTLVRNDFFRYCLNFKL
jgi:E3 ubiquitin-protein ligase TRIP12